MATTIKITAIVLFILVAGYVVLGAPSRLAGAPGSVGFGNYTAYGGFLVAQEAAKRMLLAE